MAKLTRIKILNTGATTTAPSNLKTGEFAYSWVGGSLGNNGDRLYIGTGTESGGVAPSVDIIGGKYFTGLMRAQTSPGIISTAQNPDTSSNGFVPILDSDRKVDQWNVDNLRLDGNSITSTNTNGNITIDPDQNGKLILHNVYINNDQDSLAEFIYDTVGGAVTGGTGITVTNDDAGNTSTVSITNVTLTDGNAGQEYGSTTKIPGITINAQGQVTRLREFNVATQLTVDAGDGTDTENVDLLNDDLQILGTTNEIDTQVSKTGTDVQVQIGLPNDVTIGNDLTVTTDLDVGSGNFTVAGATGNTTIAGNLTVQGSTINLGNDTGDTVTVAGNLVVQGTTTTVESTTIALTDPVLQLADDTTSADGLDRGVRFKWYDGSAVKEGFFGFDIQSERFVFTKDEDFDAGGTDEDNASSPWHDAQFGGVYAGDLTLGVSTDSTITTGAGNLILDSFTGTTVINDTVDLNGSIDVSGALTLGTDLAVAHGGTGVSSFTANGVFISNGAGTALSWLTGSEGDIVQFNSSGVPFASDVIDGGEY